MDDIARIRIFVSDDDVARQDQDARELSDRLRSTAGVQSVDRQKTDSGTMDLGSVLEVVLASGAVLSVAKGLADWLRARRGASVTIEVKHSDGSIKTVVNGIDSAAAERIIEHHV